MIEVSVEIETYDTTLAFDLFEEKKKLFAAQQKEIAKGVFLRFEGGTLREAFDTSEIIRLTIAVAKDVALPIALGVVSNWLYDRIKNGRASKIRVNENETEITKDEIKKALLKEAKEKPDLDKYSCRLSFPEFSQDEVMRGARTLSRTRIVFDGIELPYPDNMTFFAEYVSGIVEALVFIRNKEISEISKANKPLYAKAQIDEKRLPRLFFTHLSISSKPVPSACVMKKVEKEEDMPKWF